MTLPQSTVIRTAMLLEGVPETVARRVIERLMRGTPSMRPWSNIISDIDESIRVTANGQSRWRPSRAALYGQYLTLLRRVRADITHDSARYTHPADAAAAAARENAKRREEGKRPGPEKAGYWAYWVPPHVRIALSAEFERVYTQEMLTKQPPGRRIVPFTTSNQRRMLDNAWDTLRKQVEPYLKAGPALQGMMATVVEREAGVDEIEDVLERDALIVRVHTRHQERYRAAMEAARIIDVKSKLHHNPGTAAVADFTVPLHWVHVLEAPERERLRAAERAVGGNGATPQGSRGAPVPIPMVGAMVKPDAEGNEPDAEGNEPDAEGKPAAEGNTE